MLLKKISICLLAIAACLSIGTAEISACSMFKITSGGKTMVGNNEDSWSTTAKLWFEQGIAGKMGAMYVGNHLGTPQGGMNEAGLAFDGFTIAMRPMKKLAGRSIDDAGAFLKKVMQQCHTVDEVYALYSQYDYCMFPNGMLLYIDRTGKYLVVEPDTMIMGSDSAYILSNFCPSVTPGPAAVKIKRYHRGLDLLRSGGENSSLDYCLHMMDTMHECRPHLGDGTLYTNIYDLAERKMYLYFYHDYSKALIYDLDVELRKGDHVLQIPALYPPNSEYGRLLHYKTPVNDRRLVVVLLIGFAWFILSAIVFLSGGIIRLVRQQGPRQWLVRFALVTLYLVLCAYSYTILNDKSIAYMGFYMGAHMGLVYRLAAVAPVALAITVVPLLWLNYKVIRSDEWKRTGKVMLTIGSIISLLFLAMMIYWGLLHF